MDDRANAGGTAVRAGPAERIAAHLLAPLDPCVVLLQEWEHAHHMVVVLCRLQQRLETRIRNALGFSGPSGGPDKGRPNTSQSAPEYRRPSADSPAPGNNADSSTMSAAAAARTDHQRRWDALDVEVGYSRVRAAEIEAIEAEEQILDAVAATQAQSLAGVIAKLKVIVGAGENLGDTSAFPWPQIQSVLANLKELSERDGHVLPRSADGRPDDNQSDDIRGRDDESYRPRASMSDGETAVGSQPRRG